MLNFIIKNFKKIILLSSITILFGVIVCTLLIVYNIYVTGFQTEKTNIKYYSYALRCCRDKEQCSHFPLKIPKNAQNTNFYYYSAGLGGQTILLEIKENKTYINDIIKNPIYTKLSKEEVNYIFTHARGNKKNIDKHNYTFYKLNTNKNHTPFSGFGGIATDNNTKILYFYINPEG